MVFCQLYNAKIQKRFFIRALFVLLLVTLGFARWATGAPIQSTDILQEYFVPLQQVVAFKNTIERVVRKYHLNNLNITYRLVLKIPEEYAPTINYALTDMVAFVINFNVGLSPQDQAIRTRWSRELVQGALDVGGVRYLAYEPQATLFDEMLREPPLLTNEFIRGYFEQYRLRLY